MNRIARKHADRRLGDALLGLDAAETSADLDVRADPRARELLAHVLSAPPAGGVAQASAPARTCCRPDRNQSGTNDNGRSEGDDQDPRFHTCLEQPLHDGTG